MSKPTPGEVSMEWTQDEDTAGRANESVQQIRIFTASSEGTPETRYFVIETERWAYDDPAQLVALLRKVADAAGVKIAREA